MPKDKHEIDYPSIAANEYCRRFKRLASTTAHAKLCVDLLNEKFSPDAVRQTREKVVATLVSYSFIGTAEMAAFTAAYIGNEVLPDLVATVQADLVIKPTAELAEFVQANAEELARFNLP